MLHAYSYSTGPLENEVVMGALSHTVSKTVWTKVLNNSNYRRTRATIQVFALDGTKTLIDRARILVDPLSSAFHVSDVSLANEFEVQIAIAPRRAAEDVLVGVFGKDEAGNLNPSHRLVQQELTPIDELSLAIDDPETMASGTRPVNGPDA